MDNNKLFETGINDENGFDENSDQYLTFSLGHDVYGIEVKQVSEVIEYRKVFSVPRVPECIKGIINLRGELMPVIDFNARFFDKHSEAARQANIIILEFQEMENIRRVGAVIDSVRDVVNIPQKNFEETPEFGLNIRKEFVSKIGKINDCFVIVLNISAVLNIDEIMQMYAGNEKSESTILQSISVNAGTAKT